MTILPGNYVAPLVSGDSLRLVPGLTYGFIEEQVTPNGAASYDLTSKLPIGAIVINAQILLNTDVVATTAVKIGLGRKDATADPDKYALTSALTAATYNQTIITITPVLSDLALSETLQITACDTNGAAAGTLDSGGIIKARINYYFPEQLT